MTREEIINGLKSSDLEQTIIYVTENFCDKYCKYPAIIATQYQLDSVCKNCPMNKLTDLLKEDKIKNDNIL